MVLYGMEWKISRLEWKTTFRTFISIPHKISCLVFTEKHVLMLGRDKQYSRRSIQHLLHTCIILYLEAFNTYYIRVLFLTNRGTSVACIVPTIGVAKIFDWGGPKPQITRNDVIRNFRKSNFLWGKDIVKRKI